jgi:hypothetical protein
LSAWLVAASCANIVTPTGGIKDVIPPAVLESSPETGAKNYNGKNIKITFDEFVKLTDVATQVIISPFSLEQPDIKVKGKSVVVSFNDTLKSNTTYSIAFGDAISDITENNILSAYHFVFSTGSVIDSLSIKGVVKNAFTQKVESSIYVMLYTMYDDSVPIKETPLYLARTGANGTFDFYNIPGGQYKIFALKDVNSNYLFDQPNEKIAFLESLLKPLAIDTIKDTALAKNSVQLNLFEENAATQRMMKSYPAMYGKVNLVFRKPLETFDLNEIIKKGSGFMTEINKTKDTLSLWMKNPDDDSLFLEVRENNVILDTAEIALIKKGAKSKDKTGGSSIPTLRIKHSIANKSAYDYFKAVTIDFSDPISKYDFSKVIITENKDTVMASFRFDYSGILSDTIRRKLVIDYKWKEGTNYTLFIPPATFRDIFNLPNDTLKVDFKTSEQKNYGNIILNVKSENLNDHLIVQLVTESDAMIYEKFLSGSGTVKFDFVSPGSYKFKLIVDSNNNGKWDTGNYLKNIQPEKVFYDPSSIQVKANWDMNLEWSIED